MWLLQTWGGNRSESYYTTTVPLCETEIPAGICENGKCCFPWWPCKRVPFGQACKMLLWDCQPGLRGVWLLQALVKRAWQLSWGLHFWCEIGRQVKCWWDCKDELMPICHRLFAGRDRQQEAVWRFRFGLNCNRRLSDIAWLELWFGVSLYWYFIKTAFLAVEEGAKLSRFKCSLKM